MSQFKRFLLIFSISVFSVACDQATKAMAKFYLSPDNAWSFFGDLFRLQLAHNKGVFFSLGENLPGFWREALFSFGAGALLLVLLIYAWFSRSLSTLELLALSLVSAGGLGNLLDRLLYQGYVIDFMNLGIGSLRTGIFNVADMAILFGTSILFQKTISELKRP